MILEIKKENRVLGRLSFDGQGGVNLDQIIDDDLKSFIINALDSGLKQYKEHYDEKSGQFVMVQGPAEKSLLPLVLRRHLKSSGYTVMEIDYRLDEEILKILSNLQEDQESKDSIIKRLPQMSYLEKTLTLKLLKAI